MLSTINTRSVIRMLGVNDLSLNGMASPIKRRTRNFRKRENRLRRHRHLISYAYPRYVREPTCIETTPSKYLMCNKENENLEKNRSNFLQDDFKAAISTSNIFRSSSQVLCATQTVQPFPLSYELSDFESKSITRLISRESYYHPNNAFLNYVNPNVEDKVNAALRNEAIFNLRFWHTGFFILSADTFFKAVNLLDRFIVRVKVKPKYITCVSVACYYIAAKATEPRSKVPSPESLVQISRCGGTAADLRKMEEIIRTKLAGDIDGITSLDFVRTVLGSEQVGIVSYLEIALCSLEVYRYRPSCLATAALVLDKSLRCFISIKKLEAMAKFCGIEWREVQACASLVRELYDSFYSQTLPCSRVQLVWTISRRTMLNMVPSSPPPLDTIFEDTDGCEEGEDHLSLDVLFNS